MTRLEERRTPNPFLQGSNPWSPAKFEPSCGGAGRKGLPPVSKTDAPKGWGFDSSPLRQTFFDLLLDLLDGMLVYLNCVIKRFHFERFLSASFIAWLGTETVMAQRTVNQDARPGT